MAMSSGVIQKRGFHQSHEALHNQRFHRTSGFAIRTVKRQGVSRISETEVMASEIVTADFWQNGEVQYNVFISSSWTGRFIFEGRRRATGLLGSVEGYRHVHFPHEDRPEIDIGGKDEAVAFIRRLLPLWDCPEDIVERIAEAVRKWNVLYPQRPLDGD